MKSLSGLFYQLANFKSSILATVLLVLYATLVIGPKSDCFSGLSAGAQGMPDLKFAYTYTYALAFFSSNNAHSLSCFKTFLLIWDNFFPLLYACVYLFWVSVLFKYNQLQSTKFRLYNLYPLLLILPDLIENQLELMMIHQWLTTSALSVGLVISGSVITSIKWILAAINAVILAVLTYNALLKKIRGV